MAQDRHERRDTGAATDEKEGAAVLRIPRKVTAERAADLNRIANLGNVVEEGRDLAALKALDDELVKTLEPWRRCDRVASLCHIAILRGKPDVEVLASLKGAPVLGAKEEARHTHRLAPDAFDHGLLPRNVSCLNDHARHGQSPE